MLSFVKALALTYCFTALSVAGAVELTSQQQRNIDETKDYYNNRTASLNVVKTTKLSNGQLVDWIMMDSQGEIATAPPTPRGKRDVGPGLTPVPMLEEEGAELGPEGTVPVIRYNLDNLDPDVPLAQRLSKGGPANMSSCVGSAKCDSTLAAQPHWYASTGQPVTNNGGVGTFSMFDAYVQNPSADFSLLQTAVIRYDVPIAGQSGTTMQTVESGWINYPSQVQAPHLFTFYTTNGYTNEGNGLGGWNQDQSGWVQVDKTIFPGTPFSPLSTIGGSQYELQIRYYLYQGNWWLWVTNRYIGYYPATLFTQGGVNSASTLQSASSQINFYGEVYQSESSLTTTDMGSGEFPNTGFGNSGYIHNIAYTESNGDDVVYNGQNQYIVSDTSRYNLDVFWNSNTSWGSYMYLGGPGEGGVVGG